MENGSPEIDYGDWGTVGLFAGTLYRHRILPTEDVLRAVAAADAAQRDREAYTSTATGRPPMDRSYDLAFSRSSKFGVPQVAPLKKAAAAPKPPGQGKKAKKQQAKEEDAKGVSTDAQAAYDLASACLDKRGMEIMRELADAYLGAVRRRRGRSGCGW